MRFFVGICNVYDAHRFPAAFVSVNRLRARKSAFAVNDWIMDSGAFTELDRFGAYQQPAEAYADEVKRWAGNGNLLAAVTQDYMCEPFMLAKTGMTVSDHQRLTVERYDAIRACDTGGVYIMPVLQGCDPADYVRHIALYGDRLGPGAWVGVGSVCKRNGNPAAIEEVLLAINRARPDLRLHGFGIKTTALGSGLVRQLLHSADSMAWSFAARYEGRDRHCWHEAARFAERIATMPVQLSLLAVPS